MASTPVAFQNPRHTDVSVNVSPIRNDEVVPPLQTSVTSSDCEVSVQINWSSGTRRRVLPKELCSLGKMLCRGTFKQIARAAWKCKELQKDFLILIGKQIHNECSDMCKKVHVNKKDKRRIHASCLGRTDKTNILQFSFEKLHDELKEKAPLFQLVLKAASLRVEDKTDRSLHSVCVAAAVCLKKRSKNMIAFQLIVSIINNLSGFMVSIKGSYTKYY